MAKIFQTIYKSTRQPKKTDTRKIKLS